MGLLRDPGHTAHVAVTLQESKREGRDSSQSPSWVGMWEFEVKSMKTA